MSATQAVWHDKQHPWMPVDYDDNVIWAVRAVKAGVASAGQQRLFWDWLMYVSAAGDQLSFRPGAGGERDTAFAEGKRFVGLQVKKMNLPELTPAAPRETPPHARQPDQPDADPGPAAPRRKQSAARKPRKPTAGKRKPAPRKRSSPGRSAKR